MAIEKLSEFAKDGQKNTDDLNLTDGFPVSKKPARQWFNWLFNSLTLKINEIIDDKFSKSGGTLSGNLDIEGTITVSNVGDQTGAFKKLIQAYTTTDGGYLAVGNTGQDRGFVEIGTTDDNDAEIYATQRDASSNILRRATLLDGVGNTLFPEHVYAKTFNGGLNGNSSTATKLQTARDISFSGAATGSFNFDGSTNASCILTLANSGVVASTYGSTLKIPVLTVNAKGLITGVSEQNIPIVDDLTTDDGNKPLSSRQGKKLQDEKFPLTGGTLNGSMHAIAVSARGMPDYSPTEQGAYLSWNRTNGDGKADFINHKGGGGGGFNWWNGNQDNYTCVMTLNSDGSLDVSGGLNSNAATATKLKTPRNIALSGAVSGSADFDGSGNVEIITVPNTSGLRVVEGSGYTITYDDYRRIAIIELTLWTNQSIIGQTISESHATNRYQIYSLPITLKKRLSVDIQLSEGGTTTSYYGEAGEWLRYAMQDGYRGCDAASKLFVWFKRWNGSDDQPVSASATIVGIF